ncbi:MAG: nucleoside deaminase [Proteobacteria bacterium]|nr:nucleoside deaminase [Pseudomonadota bacterium]
MNGLDGLNLRDLPYLRSAIALAKIARKVGDEPYGAVVVARNGAVLAETRNLQNTTRDPTAHAEANAVRLLKRAVPPEKLEGATIYASGEPCAMCASAIAELGIRRVVFGAPAGDLPGNDPKSGYSCRAVLAPTGAEVYGPVLGDEASVPLAGWKVGGTG